MSQTPIFDQLLREFRPSQKVVASVVEYPSMAFDMGEQIPTNIRVIAGEVLKVVNE